MMKENQQLILTGEELLEILKEINLILISLHDMGPYFIGKGVREYEKETTRFIDEWKVAHRLAKIREILANKFN